VECASFLAPPSARPSQVAEHPPGRLAYIGGSPARVVQVAHDAAVDEPQLVAELVASAEHFRTALAERTPEARRVLRSRTARIRADPVTGGEVLELLDNETGMHSCLEPKPSVAELRAIRDELNRAHATRTAPAVMAPKPAAVRTLRS
jgi:hypothetical protein